jgi:cytoskeleton protein RodZ
MANEENRAAPGNRPVGPQLKKAREAKGLSVVEVAEAQYLRPVIIQAIENGRYELIDTELFLKGYIRAYARQVGLDDNALIADLNRELEPMREEQAQVKAANPLINIEHRRFKKRRAAKAALWLVALVVLGFLMFSFIDSPSQLVSLPGAGAFTGDTAEENVLKSGLNGAVSSIGDDPTIQSTPDDFLPNEASDDDVSASPANAEGVLEPLIAAGTGALSEEEAPADGSESSPVQAVGNLAVIVDNDRPAIDTEQTPQVADNRGRLEIEFIDDCWVQIRDAYGKNLASGLKRQSDRIDLRAETDIRLVIGAANAVGIMRFEGAPVDLGSKGIIGNRAEFALALNQ